MNICPFLLRQISKQGIDHVEKNNKILKIHSMNLHSKATLVGVVSILLTIFCCGFFAMAIIGPIVIYDYAMTQEYTRVDCSGRDLGPLVITSRLLSSQGTLETCVVSEESSCLYTVQLFYPPINHWLLIDTSQSRIHEWSRSLRVNSTFPCLVESPGHDNTPGITSTFDDIWGYAVMTALAGAFLSLSCLGVAICCQRHCCCRSSADSLASSDDMDDPNDRFYEGSHSTDSFGPVRA
jgi:hypothetical protein